MWSLSYDNGEALAHQIISSFTVLVQIYGLRKVVGPKIMVALITQPTPDIIYWHTISRTPIPDILTVHVSTEIKATFMTKHRLEKSIPTCVEGKGKVIPLQARCGPEGW